MDFVATKEEYQMTERKIRKLRNQPEERAMGMMRNNVIEQWQHHAGLEPAVGERAQILHDLSDAAFEAIKIIELERSGIRDGDGYWSGSDVIGHMTSQLIELSTRLRDSYPANFPF